jgi:prepilin-type N-terminal cleavage/methylation domain-containing protein
MPSTIMPSKPRCFFPRCPKAFTLVEVALALAVMGLIGAITFPLLSHLLTQQKVNRTESRLEMARGEVLGYAMGSLELPGDIADIGHQTDAWQSHLLYKPSPNMNGQHPVLCDFLKDSGSTDLRIELPDASIIANVAFALISFGPNRTQDTEIDEADGITTVKVLSPSEPVGETGRKYDDLLVYMTADYLRGRILDRCPSEEPE